MKGVSLHMRAAIDLTGTGLQLGAGKVAAG